MSKAKIFTIAAIFIIFLLPGLIMVWGSMLFGIIYRDPAVSAAVMLFLVGTCVGIPVIAEMD